MVKTMAKKKSNEDEFMLKENDVALVPPGKSNQMRYMLYAAGITLIVIAAFVIGTAVGFYGTMKFYSQGESCQPIDCPTQYTCEPGKVCSFSKCEACTSSPVLKITHGRE